jgi:hypothetical protein
MATERIGRTAIDTAEIHGGKPNEMWHPVIAPFIYAEPFISKLFYKVGIPIVGVIVLFGVGAQVLSNAQESWRSDPATIAASPSPSATSSPVATVDPTDCRDTVLAKGEAVGISNWDAVDQKFLAQYPDVVTIDPFNPAHKPYIQAWCNLAEDQIKQAAR